MVFLLRQRTTTRSTALSGIRRRRPSFGRGPTSLTLCLQSWAASTPQLSLSMKVKHCAALLSSNGTRLPCCWFKSCLDLSPRSQEESAPVWVGGGGEESPHLQLQSCLHRGQQRLSAKVLFLICRLKEGLFSEKMEIEKNKVIEKDVEFWRL